MEISCTRFDRAVPGVRALDGVDSRQIDPGALLGFVEAACEALSAARGMLAPLAAALARDAGGVDLRGGVTRAAGARTPVHLIAARLGCTLVEARRLIEAGLAMDPDPEPDDDEPDGDGDGGPDGGGDGGPDDDEPEEKNPPPKPKPQARPRPPRVGSLAEAIGQGWVAVDAAALIRATLGELYGLVDLDMLWEIEKRLVAKARRLRSLSQLRKACWLEQAHAAPAAWAAREERMRARRGLFWSEDSDGMTTVNARMDPATAAALKAWLDAQVAEAYRSARNTRISETRSPAQIRIDALATLASHGLDCQMPGSGVKTTVIVTIDHDSLRDELGLGEIDSITTPITGATLRRMGVDAELLPAVCGSGSTVLDLGRRERLFNADQRLAVSIRDGGCAWCEAPIAWAETHHLDHWADGGCTCLANAVLLCRACHTRIHDTDWTIEIHHGTVWFRPPAAIDPTRTPVLGSRARSRPSDLPDPPPPPPSTRGRPRHCTTCSRT